MTAYALELRRTGRIPEEAFEVTPEMRAEVIRRVRTLGVPLPDSVLDGGRRIIGEQLGYEIARYGFGPEAERRRRAGEDQQIRQALELVRGTTSPRALLGLGPPGTPPAH